MHVATRQRRVHGSRRIEAVTKVESTDSVDLMPSVEGLPVEQALTIEINGHPVADLICSPSATRELAVGWGFVHHFFDEPDQLRRVTAYSDRVALIVDDPRSDGRDWSSRYSLEADGDPLRSPSADGAAAATASQVGTRIPRSRFQSVVESVFARFREEGLLDGYHYAAASDGDRLCVAASDIGRGNAVDKVIGWILQEQITRQGLILCLTGRVSADIAVRARRASFDVIASSALPTAEAVQFAHRHGIAIVGRALDARQSVFSHPWRLPDGAAPGASVPEPSPPSEPLPRIRARRSVEP